MEAAGWEPYLEPESSSPCRVSLTLVEANSRRDVPNVVGGALKYALDAVTRPRRGKGGAAAIYDDSPRWLSDVSVRVEVDADGPGMWVEIEREGHV
jgi:hypothetical protein